MPITLGTNIPSFATRVQLNKTTDSLSGTFKSLSTGQKINCAGDDAAGLVISQNMQAKIDGSRQAMHNIQTAQSFLTIAEDGMVSISEHFQRINDLLTSMANDTNDVDSRTAQVREIIERLSEIDRLAQSTNFNGMNMLDGSTKSIIVQMGSDPDGNISTLDISEALTDCSIEHFEANLPLVLNPDSTTNGTDENADLIAPKKFNQDEYWISDEEPAKVYIKDKEGKYVTAKDGTELPDGKTVKAVKSGYVVENSDGEQSIVVSDGANTPKYYTVGTDAEYAIEEEQTGAFSPTNANCRAYMAIVQKAISQIATQRGLLGAYENRMDSSYSSLTTRVESLESAKVQYTDTDIAEEATKLTQKQIMQQVNIAVMANANSSQQLALSLLG